MTDYPRLAGSTNVSIEVFFFTIATGAPVTITTATGGLNIDYRRPGAANQDMPTLSDLSALTDAHTDGGLLLIGNGLHRLDLPDAACAAGVTHVSVHGTATGIAMIPVTLHLLANDPFVALNDLSAAEVNVEVVTALSDYDGPTNAELTSALAALNDPDAATVADAVWDEARAGHVGAGSFGENINLPSATETQIDDIETRVILALPDNGPGVSGGLATYDNFFSIEDAGTFATVTDAGDFTLSAGFSSVDGHYEGMMIIPTDGPAHPQPRMISVYTGATRRCQLTGTGNQVSRPFDTAPNVGNGARILGLAGSIP